MDFNAEMYDSQVWKKAGDLLPKRDFYPSKLETWRIYSSWKFLPRWNTMSRVTRTWAAKQEILDRKKRDCITPAFTTKTTAAGITAQAGRIQEGAEKSQRMTAALEKMPWSRAARMQPVRWRKEKVMGDLVLANKSLYTGDGNAITNSPLWFSSCKY